jgi:hypothetical protein
LKRNPFDVIRRGFENAMANWPVILLRVVEGLVLIGIVIGAVIAVVVPVFVSAGLSHFDINSVDSASEFFAMLVLEHWMLLVYLFLLALVIFGLLIAVHSFVEAGSARVYIDGERAPGFRAFAFDRWWAGGWRGWWPVFWIYNLAWSVAGLILLVPLTITIVAMFLIGETGARIALGCAGLAFTFLLLIPTAFVVGIWTQKAITICVSRALGAVESLRASRREIGLDFGRHFAVALIMMVIGFVAASVVSGLNIPFSLGHHQRGFDLMPLFFAPVQLMLSVVQSALSAAAGAWFLASFVALTEEH